MTYARRKDTNQDAIVAALRSEGYYVYDTHNLGCGFPDLLVVDAERRAVLLEVKNGKEKLSPEEETFHNVYPGWLHVVRSPDEALEVMVNLQQKERIT
jgi:hypothetical protein